MSDERIAYLEALRVLEIAAAQVQEAVDAIIQSATEVQDGKWKKLSVRGFGPAAPGREDSPKILACFNELPSAKEFEGLMTAYRQAVNEVDTAWKSVPAASRSGLQIPPV